jgi:membrane protease subunit (stomatin/prohibitin family)
MNKSVQHGAEYSLRLVSAIKTADTFTIDDIKTSLSPNIKQLLTQQFNEH